jgi:hypothetical protein
MCINDRSPNPSDGLLSHYPLSRRRKVAESAGSTPSCPNALGVVITLQPGDPQTQRFDAHHDRTDGMTEGQTRELVISYLSPRFFMLLALTGDAPTALQWGRGTAGDVRMFVVSDEAQFWEPFVASTIAGGEGGLRKRRHLACETTTPVAPAWTRW